MADTRWLNLPAAHRTLPAEQCPRAVGVVHPVLRLIDDRDHVMEPPHSLGGVSNSEPSQREWDEYVAACHTVARHGPPPPRLGDVFVVRDALDRHSS